MCHDLRGPLRAVDGFSQMLAKHCPGELDDTSKDCLGQIHTGVAQMNAPIDHLLKFDVSGRAPLWPKPVNLTSLVSALADGLRKTGAKRRQIL